jgi:arylsulfatase A
MRRLTSLVPVLVIVLGLCHSDAIGEDRPNIVLIYADDLGYGDLSCYGAEAIQTPHCDRVADEGMRFTDAHSPSAVCTPSRYATLTGRYAWRTWLKNWVLFEHMPLLVETDRLTIPKLLKQHGYTTGCIGKWHLGWGTQINPDFSQDLSPGPLEIGFDYFFGVPFSHNSSLKLQNFVRNRRIVGLEKDESIEDKAVQERLARRLEDTAIDLSAEAVQFIKRNQERPFFLYYPTTNIHFPITPNERFQGESDAGAYGEFVAEFDWAVGEVLQTLDELDLTRKTLLIVTSDNGGRPTRGKMGDKGHKPCGSLRGIKRQIWEGGHRVAMMVRWPAHVEPGTTCDETVCHTDFITTFAAMLDHDLPANAAEDGYSILPLLLGESYRKPLREATVHHSVNGMFAIRMGDWKMNEGDTDGDYRRGHNALAKAATLPELDPATGRFKPFAYDIVDFDQETPVYCLYNLADDPGETTNLAAKYPERVAELRKLLDRYRDSGRSTPLNKEKKR